MKKITLVLALAMTLVLAFAMSAFAAQQLDPTQVMGNGTSDYLATSKLPADLGTQYGINIYGNPSAANPTVNRIHSNYTANTNACASCHATHTGVGASLLQWESIEATCMACHDGSAGVATYNVVGGKIGATSAITNGGRFYDLTDFGSRSMHDTGATTIGAAPGGDNANKSNSASKWGKAFECTSCHTPHGQGGNARILNPDVNALATEGKVTAGLALGALTDISGNGTEWVAKDVDGSYVYQIQGYPYGSKVYTSSAVGAKALTSGFTIDNASGYTKIKFTADQSATGVYADYFPAVKVDMGITGYLQATEKVTYKSGLNTFCGACHTDYNTEKVNATQLTMNYDPTNFAWKDANKSIKVMVGGKSGETLSGTYHEAYRHQVGYNYSSAAKAEPKGIKFENLTVYTTNGGTTPSTAKIVACTTCHVAHGTDEGYWAGEKALTVGTTYPSGYAGFDGAEQSTARGSNLKRMPNMATCESCHDKGGGSAGYPY